MKEITMKWHWTKGLRSMLIVLSSVICFASCGTVEEYVLLNDLDVDAYYRMQPAHDLKIKRGDDLRIVVTHKIPQLIQMFNQKINSLDDGETLTSYTVNGNGYIYFPFFDSIKVEGMTCNELSKEIVKRIEESGIAVNPSVNVKITNFKVTVIGESGTGIYTFDDEHVTIFDLVAKANLVSGGGGGGTNIRRDKILVIREVNGVLNSDYISLLTKDVLYSPYYFLEQNDVVYVWPSQTAIRNSNKLFDYWWGRLSIITAAISTVTLFLTLFNKNN